MPDIADKAAEAEACFARSAETTKRPEGPKPCGYCYNCEEPVAEGMRWCDTDCRSDYERRKKTGRCLDCED